MIDLQNVPAGGAPDPDDGPDDPSWRDDRLWSVVVSTGLAVGAVALLLLFATLALGCPARPPVTSCTPNATQCSPEGRPQVCSPERRWYDTAPEPCVDGTECCLASSPDGPPIHACVPAGHCLQPEMADVRDPLLEPDAGAAEPAEPETSPSAGAGFWAPSAVPSGAVRDPWAEGCASMADRSVRCWGSRGSGGSREASR